EPGVRAHLPSRGPHADGQGSGQGTQEDRGPAYARTHGASPRQGVTDRKRLAVSRRAAARRRSAMRKVVIVGAGISGLALAFRLQQALPTAEVTVLERNHRPGGTIWTAP